MTPIKLRPGSWLFFFAEKGRIFWIAEEDRNSCNLFYCVCKGMLRVGISSLVLLGMVGAVIFAAAIILYCHWVVYQACAQGSCEFLGGTYEGPFLAVTLMWGALTGLSILALASKIQETRKSRRRQERIQSIDFTPKPPSAAALLFQSWKGKYCTPVDISWYGDVKDAAPPPGRLKKFLMAILS